MNPWISAVIAATGLTLVLAIVATLASVSAVRDLACAARRFEEEVGGLASEISSEAARVDDRAGQLEVPRRTRGS